ncbi:phosphopyruvate hydratase [Candidatus Woesearchaeota archaeon]|nr:phosphopyruvate hydratase [Candidatus Woesearchaeota archaeon]
MKITKIKGREVLDSRGNPTLEVEVTAGKVTGTAMVPSGASTGKHEALELRDKDKRYFGKGVLKARDNVNRISKKVIGMDVSRQDDIDDEMVALDGTPDKSRLGANAILGVSLAVARTAAMLKGKELYEYLGTSYKLPVLFANIINGGRHAGNELEFQEFMIAPVKAKSFPESVRIVSEVYHQLQKIVLRNFGKNAVNVGDEGGFAPPISRPTQALRMIEKAVDELGYNKEVRFAIDVAASEFYKKGYYHLENKKLTSDKLLDYYERLINQYPEIISIEDPFDQDDFVGFNSITKNINVQIVGDDLLVTNIKRLRTAIREKLCNALLLKVNQIGTLSEAMEAANLALKNKFKVMVSHRSGETEDTFIADLAVALGCGQIKLGAPCRGERTAKYNRLLRISESVKRFGL